MGEAGGFGPMFGFAVPFGLVPLFALDRLFRLPFGVRPCCRFAFAFGPPFACGPSFGFACFACPLAGALGLAPPLDPGACFAWPFASPRGSAFAPCSDFQGLSGGPRLTGVLVGGASIGPRPRSTATRSGPRSPPPVFSALGGALPPAWAGPPAATRALPPAAAGAPRSEADDAFP